MLSHIRLFATPGTVAHQPPVSTGFCRQEYWSGLPFPPPGDLLDPGIEPATPAPPELASEFFTTVPPEGPIFAQACIRKKNCDLAEILVQLLVIFLPNASLRNDFN